MLIAVIVEKLTSFNYKKLANIENIEKAKKIHYRYIDSLCNLKEKLKNEGVLTSRYVYQNTIDNVLAFINKDITKFYKININNECLSIKDKDILYIFKGNKIIIQG